MSAFESVFTTLISTVAFVGCLWWAHLALRKLDFPRRYGAPAGVHLLAVLAVGGTVYGAVARVLGDFYTVFYNNVSGWVKAFDAVSGLVVLAFVGWLYWRSTLDR